MKARFIYYKNMPIEREKNLYNKSTVFSQKALSNSKASSNAAMKMLLGNKKIRSVVNATEGQKLVNAMRAEAKGGSLSEQGLQRAFGKLLKEDSGNLNDLSKSELDVIGREVLGKKHKYIMPENKNNPVVSPRNSSSVMRKSGGLGSSAPIKHSRLF